MPFVDESGEVVGTYEAVEVAEMRLRGASAIYGTGVDRGSTAMAVLAAAPLEVDPVYQEWAGSSGSGDVVRYESVVLDEDRFVMILNRLVIDSSDIAVGQLLGEGMYGLVHSGKIRQGVFQRGGGGGDGCWSWS